MDDKTKILVVDDDVFMRELIESVLGERYCVVEANSGAEALAVAQVEHPALILLDVEMPGMDGYETCRQLKQADDTAAIPVIFVSARDKIEERLKGYEAGGSDYVIKPFDTNELHAKIDYLLNMISAQAELKEMASYASNTAMTAMTSMSEMGALLESLNKFHISIDESSLAQAVLAGLALYGLNGVVQVRTPEKTHAFTEHGEANPLEVSVMDHMAGMDRILQFKSRMSIHYPHVAILVNNMPVEDADRCGRLRDHLAMLVEGAEMKVVGMIAENESRRRGLAIEQMIERVTGTLNEIDSIQRRNRMEVRSAFGVLTDKLNAAMLQVGLTIQQEDFFAATVSNGIEEIINVQSTEAELQNKLTSIIREMKEILA